MSNWRIHVPTRTQQLCYDQSLCYFHGKKIFPHRPILLLPHPAPTLWIFFFSFKHKLTLEYNNLDKSELKRKKPWSWLEKILKIIKAAGIYPERKYDYFRWMFLWERTSVWWNLFIGHHPPLLLLQRLLYFYLLNYQHFFPPVTSRHPLENMTKME